jgi:hypothetical protein
MSVVILDELLMEHYGNKSFHDKEGYKHGQVSGLECWNKIFATALPTEVSSQIATKVLVKLRKDFRERLGMMGLNSIKQLITVSQMDDDDMKLDYMKAEGHKESKHADDMVSNDSEDMDFESEEDFQGGEDDGISDLVPMQAIGETGLLITQSKQSPEEAEGRQKQ